MSPGLSQAPSEEPESEHPSSLLDAPEFPDFENSEMETAEGEAVDIGSLELEAFDLVSTDIPVQDDSRVTDFEVLLCDSEVCDPVEPFMSTCIQDLNLGNQNIIPLDPAIIPEPINISEFQEPAVSEQWFQSEEISNFQAVETDLGAAECHSAAQEPDHPAAFDDGTDPE